MRHAACTPPPPDFVICGLLQLTFFGKLQNVAHKFEVSARSYKFSASSLPVLCRYFALSWWRLHSFRVLRPAFDTHCYCQCSASSLHWASCLAAICSHVMQETVPKKFQKTCKTEAKWVPRCTTNHTKRTLERFGRPF